MGSTFSGQTSLPKMPIPELSDTCYKFIEWSKPLLTKQEAIDTNKVVQRFLQPGAEGEQLQKQLHHWSGTESVGNWSAPVWQNLYLQSRSPLVINSNVFYYLKSKLDEQLCSQAHIAAALISTVYDFIALLENKQLTPDRQKTTPLCMNQYKNLFSSIRIPCQTTDTFQVFSEKKHIVVLHNQSIFKVEILDGQGNRQPASSIKRQVECILSSTQQGQNIGLLTTLNRDDWAETRTKLLDLSADNVENMQQIEQAAFAICLDQNSPEQLIDISKQCLHGSGIDRLFDKSLQFIVFKNGKTGINFEHTGVDGSVMLRLIAHIYDTIDTISFETNLTCRPSDDLLTQQTKSLIFDLNDHLHQKIQSAIPAFHTHITNTHTCILNFDHFGKQKIKTFKVSPDAFVQLALQLAEYKLYGQCYSAYEAVMTRTFLDGRIDVLYTVSPESLAFIQHIQSNDSSQATTAKALIEATRKHTARANECRQGKGVHTHLLALKYCYQLAGEDLGIKTLPTLFSDKGYQALTESVVCTSTTSEYGVELAGYGPIVDHGFGIRYFVRDNSICFNMTSRTKLRADLDKMTLYIEQALLEMAEIMAS
ncbi:choline/carnitine O-acyltransferase [Vibrio sp. MA40-2]|uniref:choline/carnitine O-acyltransferase n=1 Tax=Vibrio sp. MA40-2 TaxID=3391828 RepID=UPI0039A7448B